MLKKDLISITELSREDIKLIFDWTVKIKRSKNGGKGLLSGKSLGLIFEKPSSRTRISFEVAMYQLGGQAIYLGEEQIQLGKRESVADVARTVSRYIDGVVLRTFSHETILEFARFASIAVINGLSDLYHPCQVLADIFTFNELKGKIKGKTVAFIGDGNNVARSWIWGAAKTGINLVLSSPLQYKIEETLIKEADKIARKNGGSIQFEMEPHQAVKNADLIYTDVWVSMGQEEEREKREKSFAAYQVNDELLSLANPDCLVMHCLPAHRGEEITNSVLDGKHSVVWDEAENRLHVQKAILYLLLGKKLVNF